TAAQEAVLHASGNGTPLPSKDYCMLYNPHWTALPHTLENAFPPSGNKSEFHDVKILIAFINHKDFKDMKQTLGDNITVKMYSPSWPNFDYTMVVIFVIAVFTVALGGYWSGLIELENMKAVTNAEDREMRRKKEEYLTFSPLTVVIFVVICCVMMVLLYFFYKWLVYVMITIFCIASAMSLYNCLAALIHMIPCGRCTYSCVILLGLLLLYDVFFVFLTPFITKNGESIMVELAAGPFGNNEKLPVVIRVPKLAYFSVMSVCLMPVSILGFGDIIVPGLLTAYCRRFDVQTGSSIYYVSSTIAYAVGMILTFVVLVLMKKGQPALLYLVPCTLITASIVAWRRKEMKKFWKGNGYQMMDHLDYATNEESPVTTSEQIAQQ
ncbi:hypothetical protein MC885_005913, partial [Smutsia gigantea]